ncbi:DUF4917 family protein [Neisseria weaveri]|uniref:DUF4917 domain-containing protein n=1 Tax=Neisseria weaveri TaxID=28091 RepID=A0A448VPZ7_9NEIS|nr:DUF4917 family protein [Neisseria weaveri]EGV37737.1 hypothetical protein l11_09780 [Neisseria weaveri LMG 5135]VEJ51885.1 Uncharacterised protein [Neisseria weaveri]
MNYIKILDWNNISEKYNRSTILLGNGASIAVNNCFNYQSLLNIAKQKFKQKSVEKLFKHFETDDFELILRLVWQGKEIIDIVKNHDCIHYRTLTWAYEDIRNGLIESVREVHPNYSSIGINQLEKISNFLRNFNTVISLNYDLIVYWASLNEKDKKDSPYSFKDCFIHKEFKDDWTDLRKPYKAKQHCTLIFYPHGNLILHKDIKSSEFKLSSYEDSHLLETILNAWKKGNISPLFVSEGTAKQKIKSIRDSYYLSVVYREVLTEKKESLVVYGWGFGEQDMHILKQMKNCGIKNIAVSVYNGDMEYCFNVRRLIKRELENPSEREDSINVEFFHSNSEGCWIY